MPKFIGACPGSGGGNPNAVMNVTVVNDSELSGNIVTQTSSGTQGILQVVRENGAITGYEFISLSDGSVTTHPDVSGFEPIKEEKSDREFLRVCKIDDTLSDGSKLVEYVEFWCIEKDQAGLPTSTPVGTYTDSTLSTNYTVVGTSYLPGDIGVPAVTEHKIEVLNGPMVFNYPVTAIKFSYTVAAVGNPADPPTIDNDGDVTGLDIVGLSVSSDASGKASQGLYANLPTLTLKAGDIIVAAWDQITGA